MKEELGVDGPGAVVRRYCSDLVKLNGKRKGKSADEQGQLQNTEKRSKKQKKTATQNTSSNDALSTDNINNEGNSELNQPVDLFSKLPADKLWSQEKILRTRLFQWMLKQQEDNASDCFLMSEASEDPTIGRHADKFLRRYGVPSQEWIEQRLAEDIAVGLDDQ